MSLPCPVPSCIRVMPGHLRACRACSTELLRDLRDVPSLAHHLELAATRQTRLGTSSGPAQEVEAHEDEIGLTIRRGPLPWNERARTAQAVLRTVLVGWVRTLQHGVHRYEGPICRACEHRSCTYLSLSYSPADTLPAMATWLIRHRAQLLGRTTAPEAIAGIRDAIHDARRAIDRPADRVYAGPCNTCGADLLASPGARTVVCRPCTLIYDIGPRLAWMRKETEDRLGNASWVAAVATSLGYQISAAAVRGLARRGRVIAKGHDTMGHPTYRVGDVLDIMSA